MWLCRTTATYIRWNIQWPGAQRKLVGQWSDKLRIVWRHTFMSEFLLLYKERIILHWSFSPPRPIPSQDLVFHVSFTSHYNKTHPPLHLYSYLTAYQLPCAWQFILQDLSTISSWNPSLRLPDWVWLISLHVSFITFRSNSIHWNYR